MSQEKPFYVYVHRYSSGPKKGQVFYVGKGKDKRAWVDRERSFHWDNIVAKYGYTIGIVCRFKSEVCAFSFEMAYIGSFQKDQLCNISIGGDGSAGHISPRRKKVYCSNGMVFDSSRHAGSWVGSKYAHTSINRCCIGKSKVAYGYAWAYDKKPTHPKRMHLSKKSKTVYCSNGMIFHCLKDAADWAGTQSGGVIDACNGVILQSGGYAWSYKSTPKAPDSVYNHLPITRSDGVSFDNSTDAANSIGVKAQPSAIAGAARGIRKTAYGYKWKFTSKDDTIF